MNGGDEVRAAGFTHPGTAEVMADQVGLGDAEGVQAAPEVGGVAVDGVAEAGRLVGPTEPRLVPGDGAGKVAGPLQERHPVLAGAGVARAGRSRLARSDRTIGELTDLRTQALARLAAQHDEIVRLRGSTVAASRVARLPSRDATIGPCS